MGWAGVFLKSWYSLSTAHPQLSTIVFIDGQNLFHTAKECWSKLSSNTPNPYLYPSYDVEKLARFLVSLSPDRQLKQIRLYTGVPKPDIGPKEKFWHAFWSNKIAYLKSHGVYVYKGKINSGKQEKGVDVNLAIDLIELTYDQKYDVAIIASQDWDFGGAASMAKKIAKNQGRYIHLESAFPYSSTHSSFDRGIPGTKWIKISKDDYDSCFDPNDYR